MEVKKTDNMRGAKDTTKYRIAGYVVLFILFVMLGSFYLWLIFGHGF